MLKAIPPELIRFGAISRCWRQVLFGQTSPVWRDAR
jgi:hypothetical protein